MTRRPTEGRSRREIPATPPGDDSVRRLEVVPATPERWPDLERLFGSRGACAGCWCMFWRATAAEVARGKGDGNRRSMQKVVASGEIPGLLAYAGAEPVGWCAVAPRERYPRLARSRTLAPVDENPVWSIVCFFVARGWRRRGVTARLLEGALQHVRERGGRILEGYPVEPRTGSMPDAFAWTGLASAFRKAGFSEVARRSETRPIFRRELRPAAPAAPARPQVARRPAAPARPAMRGPGR